MTESKDLSPKRNAPTHPMPTGGNPARPSNAGLMRFVAEVERYTSGKPVQGGKVAQQASGDQREEGEDLFLRPDPFSAKYYKALLQQIRERAGQELADNVDRLINPREVFQPKMAEKIASDVMLKMQCQLLEKRAKTWKLRPPPTSPGEAEEEAEDTVEDIVHGPGKTVPKIAGEEREPEVDNHVSAPVHKMRPRAEVVLFNNTGCYCIDKGDYILLPGGGIDDGEQPRDAAIRETIEESGRHPINVDAAGVVEAVWPKDSGNEFWDSSEFDGERTYFFIGVDAGESGGTHPDMEDFKVIGFDRLIDKLNTLAEKPGQEWAKRNNLERVALVKRAKRLVRTLDGVRPRKQAQDELFAERMRAVKVAQLYLDVGELPPPEVYERLNVAERKYAQAQAGPAPTAAPPPGGTSSPVAQAGLPTDPAKEFVESLKSNAGMVNQPPGQAIPQQPMAPPGQSTVQPPPGQMGSTPLQEGPAEQPAVVPKLGADEDDAGLQLANLTPESNQTIQAGVHGTAQAAEQIEFAQRDPIEQTNKSPSGSESVIEEIEPVKGIADKIAAALIEKSADAVQLLPRREHILFTPQGQLILQRLQNRRFRLPEEGPGRPAPYESNVQFIPPGGVPEEGYHGYDVGLQLGQTNEVPEGFEPVEPEQALKDFYASFGLAANRPYRSLDRARMRAIMRHLKKQKKKREEEQQAHTVAPVSPDQLNPPPPPTPEESYALPQTGDVRSY